MNDETVEQYEYDLFVLYVEEDEKWVVGYLLPELGLPENRVITPKSFKPGAQKSSEIARAITTSRYTLAVLSTAFANDEVASLQLEQAASPANTAGQSERLIPLLREQVQEKLYTASRVPLSFIDDAYAQDAMDSLRRTLDQPEPPPEELRCPYPGMQAYTQEQAGDFYGRDTELDALKALLEKQHFVVLRGNSASGKTSLIHAGLLPHLGDLPYWYPGYWVARDVRLGLHPAADLVAALGVGSGSLEEAITRLLEGQSGARRLLLVVDHFEDLFNLSLKDSQDEFLRMIKALLEDVRCSVLIAIRNDYFSTLRNSLIGPVAAEQIMVLSLPRQSDIEAIIEKPAEGLGVYVDPRLTDELKRDAADEPGMLLYLQATLQKLWLGRRRRYLPLEAYRQLDKEGRGLATAVATQASDAIDKLEEDQRRLAMRFFLRLIQFGEGRSDTRRQQRFSDMDSQDSDTASLRPTLTYLEKNGLLILGEDETVDLAHEGLIDGWHTLAEWVKDHREAEKTRRRLEQQAAQWVANDRKGTLLGGADLDEAEKWLDGVAARDVGYDEEVRTFVNESLKAEEKRKQDRELELKRAQELAKERLESAQRLRTRLVMAVAALLVTVIALVFAWSEYQMAQTQLRFAKMQALANQSVAELARDPQLSLLLALDAVGIARGSEDPVPSEVKSALQQATDESRVHATLCCHTSQVHSVAYGPPGTRLIVSAAGDNTPILWDTQTLTRTGLLGSLDGQDGHTDAVLTARFSPDGRHIVTGSRDHEVKIWDAATRTVSTTLKKHGGSVSSVAFSPDGRHLATASRDKTVLIWSATAAEYEQEGEAIKPGIGELVSVAWSPESDQLVIVGLSGKTPRVVIWDRATQRVLHNLEGHTGAVYSAAYNPDGSRIVTASVDGTAIVWEAATGKRLLTLPGHKLTVNSATYNHSGSRIATAGYDGSVRVWDASSGTELFTLLGHGEAVMWVDFSPDDASLVSGDLTGTVKVWDVTNRMELAYEGIGLKVWDAAYSPDGAQIVTANEAAPVVIWHTPGDRASTMAATDVYTLSGHTQLVRSASYSHDGRYLLTSSLDGTAKIWDASEAWKGKKVGLPLAAITPTFELRRYALTVSAWHPDDTYIAIAGYIRHAEMYQVVTSTGKPTLKPDPIFTTPGQEDFVFSVGFSPDGRFLATGNAGPKAVARIWDISNISTSHVITTLVGHGNAINTLAYSPNGKCILTSSDDTTAMIWSAPGGQRLQTLNGHTREVYSAAWNSDGSAIVTASKDGTSRVWDAATAEVREILRGPSSWVTSAEFSPDDKYIITASADGIARQYTADLEKLLDRARTLVKRGFTPGEVEAYQISPPPSRGLIKWPILGGLGAGTSASSACAGTRP